ncbi:D-3-phosphoglycerate dehydrogenase [Chloroherpeton thalassium ATCC 35110]|uniref:D-3-phosphoglycerate dehydrogenase n=1 Tax=Chloroherpeton thalassium (strain ATCC 35110 / GB-78) TaxID=517418 RepID=B3QTE6_CHLT3|nr:phosphoglycerate dehydrogenase [Chloroherpeton thalassium]ACF12692.1 D-3-phosphoglycerate dehydrogenase [Chloroherpeton thalassium ATCC 35110]
MKVLITDNVNKDCGEILSQNGYEVTEKAKLSKDELKSVIKDYEILIVRSATKVTSDVIEVADNLKLIGRAGAGVDNIDIEAATRKGIIVMNTPGGNTVSAAEHACGMLLATARNIPQASAQMHQAVWDKKKWMGAELEGKTLSVIGLGKIGREVAVRMQAFGMKTVGYDPMLPEEFAAKMNIELLTLSETLKQADFITIHSSLNESTKNLICKETIEIMKDGVYIVNCARGGIVNEFDLAEAIKSGKVAGAALDVFAQEPIVSDNPLIGIERVIMTPHIAASTEEAQVKVAIQIAEQIVEWKNNHRLNGAVNASAIELAQAPEVKPFLSLSEKLGVMIAQLATKKPKHLNVWVSGDFLRKFSEVITAAVLKGFLDVVQEGDINYINAAAMANDMGLDVEQRYEKENFDYTNLIRVELETEACKRMIGGAVLGAKELRVVMIDKFLCEFKPEGQILIYNNQDKPGVLARVGMALLKRGLNIASVALSRDEEKKEALTVISLDDTVDTEVLEDIEKVDGVFSPRLIKV